LKIIYPHSSDIATVEKKCDFAVSGFEQKIFQKMKHRTEISQEYLL